MISNGETMNMFKCLSTVSIWFVVRFSLYRLFQLIKQMVRRLSEHSVRPSFKSKWIRKWWKILRSTNSCSLTNSLTEYSSYVIQCVFLFELTVHSFSRCPISNPWSLRCSMYDDDILLRSTDLPWWWEMFRFDPYYLHAILSRFIAVYYIDPISVELYISHGRYVDIDSYSSFRTRVSRPNHWFLSILQPSYSILAPRQLLLLIMTSDETDRFYSL